MGGDNENGFSDNKKRYEIGGCKKRGLDSCFALASADEVRSLSDYVRESPGFSYTSQDN
jgi:hypothetical protein